MSSLAPNSKRQKTEEDEGVTAVEPVQDQLRSWVSSRFTSPQRESLLSSPNVHAINILQFVLECVFNWSEVTYDSEHSYTTGERYCEHVDRDGHIKALAFVTDWLRRNPPNEVKDHGPTGLGIPSLTRLCAQRIAMGMFHTFCDDIDRHFDDKNLEYFTDTLRGDIASKLIDRGVPENWHGPIAEELFIFAVVYILYVDLRTMPGEPSGATNLQLPICEGPRDECWWENFGQHCIVESVPDHGRGSLAKVGLLSHAVYSSYRKALSEEHPQRREYGHLGVIELLFDRERNFHSQHPFAHSAALAPISSSVHAFFVSKSRGYSDYIDEVVDITFIPWIRRSGRKRTGRSLYCLLKQVIRPVQQFDELHPFSTQNTVDDCLEQIHAGELFNDICLQRDEYDGDFVVKRLRLNGNFSKGEILRAAIVSRGAEILDLECCNHLDEQCLDLVLLHMKRVKVVLLGGTSIDRECDVIKNKILESEDSDEDHFYSSHYEKKQKIRFVFSEDVCKCCGRRSGSIKKLKKVSK